MLQRIGYLAVRQKAGVYVHDVWRVAGLPALPKQE
ncbi:MAG: hypothetical protein FD165_172 [Gammaproteobacteria bacterium]|nr:MAG: hypothetical protein FD165_172 [Gammaproteobacteria bacterium]TND06750.1 MAG: hypothetical protein FD120_482 [Gammaproteobacteria bacterium]